MDCETDGELFAKRKSWRFEMQTVEITQDDLSWMIGRRVYMQISAKGKGIWIIYNWTTCKLSMQKLERARSSVHLIWRNGTWQKQADTTNQTRRVLWRGGNGVYRLRRHRLRNFGSGPWIRVSARDKYSESDPWTGQAGKNEPAYESGTAYSGDFEFEQKSGWIDSLLDEAVDVRQRFESWGLVRGMDVWW